MTVAQAPAPLAEAREEALFGGKAVQLGEAARAGLPVPDGVAVPAGLLEDVVASRDGHLDMLAAAISELGPVAVRSSGIGEDGHGASFAGQHLTVLNVRGRDGLADALEAVHRSSGSEAAGVYRRQMNLDGEARTAAVVQAMVPAEVAGVMFTRNPVSGADELLVEASWGLGESVVAGRVVPDAYRIEMSGKVVERIPGAKELAISPAGGGGVHEQTVDSERARALCLGEDELAALHRLALRAHEVFGSARDIEFAFAGGELYLLQCRPITV